MNADCTKTRFLALHPLFALVCCPNYMRSKCFMLNGGHGYLCAYVTFALTVRVEMTVYLLVVEVAVTTFDSTWPKMP